MELRHLQTFLTLSEVGSFTKTASKLGYAQSNITAQIKQLELELGGQLFNRLGHSITLTEKGRKLVPYATKLLSLSQETIASVAQQSDQSISIIASESLCTYRLPKLIQDFRVLYPEAEFKIQLLNNDDYYTSLASGEADFAYTLSQYAPNPYVIELLSKEEIIGTYAVTNHELAKKEVLTCMDYKDVPLILTGPGCCYRGVFLNELNECKVPTNIILETSSLQVIKEMALSGIGICLLPKMTVSRELTEHKLITLQEMNYGFSSSLMIHKDKVCSKIQQTFLDYAIDKLSKNS